MINTTHMTRSRRLSSAALAFACVGLLQGCRVGPRYVAPNTPAPPAFKEAPQQSADGTTWIPATPQDATLRGNWWYVAPRNGHVTFFSAEALKAVWAEFGFEVISHTENLHMAARLPRSRTKHGRGTVRSMVEGALARTQG